MAVAMVSVATGRVGFLYFSSSQAAGVDHDALVAVTRRAGQEALALGASLVQAVLPASSAADGALLQAAGFEHLAEMICLEQNLAALPQASPAVCAGMTYETGHEIPSGVWEELIAQTYQDSCDCPLLRGRRAMPDVVASLRLPGRYWPGHWYLVQIDGQRAGCLLINQATSPQSAEVAYLGVAPAFRGRGLSRAMLHHAMRGLRREGILSLCLVVDAENAPARRVYQAAGFMEIERKQAFTLLPNRR